MDNGSVLQLCFCNCWITCDYAIILHSESMRSKLSSDYPLDTVFGPLTSSRAALMISLFAVENKVAIYRRQ